MPLDGLPTGTVSGGRSERSTGGRDVDRTADRDVDLEARVAELERENEALRAAVERQRRENERLAALLERERKRDGDRSDGASESVEVATRAGGDGDGLRARLSRLLDGK